MALAADYRPGWFSQSPHLLVTFFALLMECILQSNCIVLRLFGMACAARLPFTAAVVQIGIEIMMALETVNFTRMILVIECNRRSLMFSEFGVV